MTPQAREPKLFGWDVVRLLGSALAALVLTPALMPAGAATVGTPWGHDDVRAAGWLALGLAVLANVAWDLARRNPRRDAAILALAIAFVGGVAQAVVLQHVGALDCAKARRSLGDMVVAGSALEDHRRARGAYPGGDVEQLARALEPTYVAKLPRRDGWGRPFAFDVTPERWSIATAALGDGPITLDMRGLTGWPPYPACGCPGDLVRVLAPPAPADAP